MTRVRIGAALIVAIVTATAVLTAGSSGADPKLHPALNGAKEVPGPGAKDGSGKATVSQLSKTAP